MIPGPPTRPHRAFGLREQGGQVVEAPRAHRRPVRLTARYLRGDVHPLPKTRRSGNGTVLSIAAQPNTISEPAGQDPLHMLVCITGVSGSGKSTLIEGDPVSRRRPSLPKESNRSDGKIPRSKAGHHLTACASSTSRNRLNSPLNPDHLSQSLR